MTWLPSIPMLGQCLGIVALALLLPRLVVGPRAQQGQIAPLRRGLGTIAALSLPFVAADLPLWGRSLITGLGIVLAAKIHECARGRISDPRLAGAWPLLYLWFFVPSDLTMVDEGARADVRRRGRQRWVRAGIKGVGFVAMLAVASAWPDVHADGAAGPFWALWTLYWLLSGLADLYTGTVMQTGIDVAEIFRWPPLSRSPQEFWGRRWNRYVGGFAHRHVFLPGGGRRSPLRRMLLVFGASGLMHEYLVVGSVGPTGYAEPGLAGSMMGFFVVHGLATVAQVMVRRTLGPRRRLPRAMAVALHLAWLAATAPVFFGPLQAIYGFQSWRLW